MTAPVPVPFSVYFAEKDVAQLKERLKHARWPDELEMEGSQWRYGIPVSYLKELSEYWQHSFDFKATAAYLNTFPQFTLAGVNGIEKLHFIHQRSSLADAIPLIILHGWPGSYFEFHKIVQQLANPSDSSAQAFHVVAPSLPGFGWSSAPTKPGFGINQMAKTADELMTRLGYSSYVAQGGDWGSAITATLGRTFPERCKAIHLNMVMAGPSLTNPWHLAQLANTALPLLNKFPLFVSKREAEGMRSMQEFFEEESGYFREQSTKPQTLGYGLTDSPLGLLAWISEKFWRWVDRKGSDTPEPALTKDEILTNISLYWFSGNITSSLRIYYEYNQESKKGLLLDKTYCRVPMAAAIFPKELGAAPKAWVKAAFNLKRWTEMTSGGHFAALEEPDALATDMRAFFTLHH